MTTTTTVKKAKATADWRSDPILRKAVVEAHLAGYKGPMHARWHVAPLAMTRWRTDDGHRAKIDFAIYPNNNNKNDNDNNDSNSDGDVQGNSANSDVATNNKSGSSAASGPSAILGPLRLSMLYDEGNADANTGWFASVTDHDTGERVAIASGLAGDCETVVRWTGREYAARRYRAWGDVPLGPWEEAVAERGGVEAGLGISVWFCADKQVSHDSDGNEAETRALRELERLVAVAAYVKSSDLPCTDLPADIKAGLLKDFLEDAFRGTPAAKLPAIAVSTIAEHLDPPGVYVKGLVPDDSEDSDEEPDEEEDEEEEEVVVVEDDEEEEREDPLRDLFDLDSYHQQFECI
ncbi:hypothetical protein DFJ73DRAFT_950664 [Zopfochytrium polystomum]|nr:hypothetical protein DFJ73DRAFT_950664 [Zopfochytrium polystomum]